MSYSIKNELLLKKILWLDTLLGGATAIIGLLYFAALATVLGFTNSSIITVAIINLLYAIFAFILAVEKPTSVKLLRLLIYANWIWTAISVLMIFTHFSRATNLGGLFLLLQPVVVGGLAYLEKNQIVAVKAV